MKVQNSMFVGVNNRVTYQSFTEAPLVIDDLRKDLKDSLIFKPQSQNTFVLESLDEGLDWVTKTLRISPIGYVTGGFQGSVAHLQLFEHLSRLPIIMGLEPDSYIEAKGTRLIMPLVRRIEVWRRLLPNNSRIFIVPEGVNYDELAKTLGVYKRAHVYHIACREDSPDVKAARLGRCAEARNYLEVSFTDLHTSDYK